MATPSLREIAESLPRDEGLRAALAPHLIPGPAPHSPAWVWVEAVEAAGTLSVLSLHGPGLEALRADLLALDGRCWADGGDLGPALARSAARLDAALGLEPLADLARRYGLPEAAFAEAEGTLIAQDGLPDELLGLTVTTRAGG